MKPVERATLPEATATQLGRSRPVVEAGFPSLSFGPDPLDGYVNVDTEPGYDFLAAWMS